MSDVYARAAEYNARFAIALDDWSDAHPMKPCPHARCKGGVHETHDAAGKLVKITGCETCRGLGRVVMNAEEIRAEYRLVRERACERMMMSWSMFDARVSRLVMDRKATSDLAPGHWLAAARAVAAGR